MRLLDAKPDLLLGFDPHVTRHDRHEPRQAGDTLVLYTDWLVENHLARSGR